MEFDASQAFKRVRFLYNRGFSDCISVV